MTTPRGSVHGSTIAGDRGDPYVADEKQMLARREAAISLPATLARLTQYRDRALGHPQDQSTASACGRCRA